MSKIGDGVRANRANVEARKRPRRPAADLIDRLDGVRQVSDGQWVARCPSHADRSPSLSVRRVADRWLVHCFAGCAPADICRAVGIELADLFDDGRVRRNGADRHRLSAADRLELVEHEITVAAMITANVVEQKTIREDDWRRLAAAAARIGRARYV